MERNITTKWHNTSQLPKKFHLYHPFLEYLMPNDDRNNIVSVSVKALYTLVLTNLDLMFYAN